MSLLKQHVGLNTVKLQVQVREVGENDVVLPLKKIVRPAQTEDLEKVEENRLEAERAFSTGVEKIKEHKLRDEAC